MKKVELSIVIPVYNSQSTIGLVVESLIYLYNKEFLLEIILIDDNSIDDSLKICEKMGNLYANVKVIHHKKNQGQHQALMTGLKQCSGNFVVLMDDDMQNPPFEVKKLINKIQEGYDVVIAKRITYNQTWLRKFLSSLNQSFIILSTKQKISFSNFLIMRKSVVKVIVMDSSTKPIIQGILLRSKANITNILTEHHMRGNSKSNYSVMRLFKFWLTTLHYMPKNVKYTLLLLILIVSVALILSILLNLI
ncbi:glycosyltransferase family 2 protein [Metasolibacillus meyeri]|uniref:glycosyltransferase family 2 protein n=1 Tax=Metasolibacillus meyeri TaxID=1071052 RepID=UPI00187D62EF|nr:glycosyltransferase family 2 protein [Metasolibacillus meyeri]